jgi:hypothetical protein
VTGNSLVMAAVNIYYKLEYLQSVFSSFTVWLTEPRFCLDVKISKCLTTFRSVLGSTERYELDDLERREFESE